MAVQIVVQVDKCGNPDLCKKCLRACPAGIFMLTARGKHRRRLANPPEHVIKTHFTEMCSLCMECIKICPKKAISIQGHQ